MAVINTGNLDISQIRTVELSGGGNGAQLVTTTVSAKTAGDLAIWDANGNLIDAGSGAGVGVVTAVTASAPITSSGGINPNIALTTPLAVTYGGTGTATPGLVAGTRISVTGTWPDQTIAVTGGVTSVGIAVPGDMAVSGSPVTSSGIITLSDTTQTANTVKAGPTSGSAATPAYRALVAADLPAGTGTVTSVAMTVPTFLSVSGTPVTTSGTLAITTNNESANQVFAGPASGSATTPAFRVLVPADLPVATASSLGIVEPDNATITIIGGVITAVGTTGAPFSLTTTGTAGAATFSSGILNIPVYNQNLVLGFGLYPVTVGNNVGPMLSAPHAGTISKCKVCTKSSDATTALQFRIKQNGADIFSTNPTVSAGTSSGTVSTFTSLTSSPLSVAADDVFQIDVLTGSGSWNVTIQLLT